MPAQSNKNKSKKKSSYSIGNLIGTLLVTILAMFLIGYFGMTIILGSFNHSEDLSGQTEISDEASSNEEAKVTLSDVDVTFEPIKLYAVQVSSLADKDSADNAVEVLASEGLPVTYAHIGSYYKVFACITTDEAMAEKMVKRIVERFPKYKDAYVTTIDIEISDLSVAANDMTASEINQRVLSLIESYDALINQAQIDEEIDSEAVKKLVSSAEEFFDQINSETGAHSILDKLSSFTDDLSSLVSRNANIKEYNKLWLTTVIE